MRLLIFYLVLILIIPLSACGGGGNNDDVMSPDSTAPTTPLPQQALCTLAHVEGGGSDGDCIRSLVPGAARFYRERTRITAGTESPLRFIDENPDFHATWVHNVAERMAFVPPPTPFTVNLIRTDSAPRTILENEFDDDSGLIVNISYGPLFSNDRVLHPDRINGLDLPPDLIVSKDVVLVIAAGNQGSDISLGHGQTQGEQAIATERVLFVAGLDLAMLRQGVYAISQDSNSCGWGKYYCVMASYTTPIPGDPNNISSMGTEGGSYNGTSFATPMVSSLLANALLLWPTMTSPQIVELAQRCARPINADGTLGAWGDRLSPSEASDLWGQGVFSVECLYATNGLLTNPITNVALRGSLSLSGTTSALTLADQVGRTYSLSQQAGAARLSFLPTGISSAFATGQNIIAIAWRNVALGMRIEENGFFGTQGTQDFRIGDSMILMMQLSHHFNINNNMAVSFYGLSTWGKMTQPASASVVRKARGHAHQIGTAWSYRKGGFQAKLGIIHAFGVTANIDLDALGRLHLSPKNETRIKTSISLSF